MSRAKKFEEELLDGFLSKNELHVYACFDCDDANPCVFVVSGRDAGVPPTTCPYSGEAGWKSVREDVFLMSGTRG